MLPLEIDSGFYCKSLNPGSSSTGWQTDKTLLVCSCLSRGEPTDSKPKAHSDSLREISLNNKELSYLFYFLGNIVLFPITQVVRLCCVQSLLSY